MTVKDFAKELKLDKRGNSAFAGYTPAAWCYLMSKKVEDLRYKDIVALSAASLKTLEELMHILYGNNFDVLAAYNTFWEVTRSSRVVVWYTYLDLVGSKHKPHRSTLTRIVKQNKISDVKITWLYYKMFKKDLI